MKKIICIILVLALFTGCASISTYDQIKYDRLQMRLQKHNLPEIKDKNPSTAAALNIFFGCGNAYLEQWGLFVANLLLWPYSIIWGMPQAAIDAGNINKQKTLMHYEHGLGKEELEKLEKSLDKGSEK